MMIDSMAEHPAAFSCKRDMAFDREVAEVELTHMTTAFLSALTIGLKDLGCRLIGHIKGLLDGGDSGHLMFSITTFDDDVHFKGRINEEVRGVVLTINIIVYGIEKQKVGDLFEKSFHHAF